MRRHQIQHNYLHSSVKVCQCHWINQFAENFILPPRPIRPIGPLILGNARLVHLNTRYVLSNLLNPSQTKNPPIPLIRVCRYVIPPPGVDRARRYKVLVEVVHILEHVALHRTRDGDVVDQATVLRHQSIVILLYQTKMIITLDVRRIHTTQHLPHAGTPGRQTCQGQKERSNGGKKDKLGSHEQYTQYLTNPRQPTRVDLHNIDRLCLQQLLEQHPIMRVFPRRHADAIRS